MNGFGMLAPVVVDGKWVLAGRDPTPAWIVMDPTNGKCQLIWYIEKVYTAKGQTSPNARLLIRAAQQAG